MTATRPTTTRRRRCLAAALAAALAPTGATAQQQPADTAAAARPNVVFILADDLGWADTSLYGHTRLYRTPNLERLAARGVTFARAYSASPLCSPTRAAIMTGLSPARTGFTAPHGHLPDVAVTASPGAGAAPHQRAVPPRSATRLDTRYRTLAEALKEAGYATGHFGKWHLGRAPHSPLEHGFDVDVPHWPGPGPAGSYVAPWKFRDFEENSPNEHIEDRMAAEAVAWMKANQSRPFFLNYWMFSVHAPFDAKPDLIDAYRGRVDPSDAQRSPTYAAMVESMDDAVGTLLDAIDRLGIAESTVVVFTSDNGGNMYSPIDGTVPTSNRPLRGGKATIFDGGTRVPAVVAWPGRTIPGTRSDALLQSEDFYPTLLAGLAIEPARDQIFDGVDIGPALEGEPFDRPPLVQYFPHNPPVPDWLPPSVSIHRGDWKLIRVFHGGSAGAHRHLLFDLGRDPGESNDLAAREPERVRELGGLVGAFLESAGALVPVPNPEFDPAVDPPLAVGEPRKRRQPNRR